MKAIFEYDPSTGAITDSTGCVLINFVGAIPFSDIGDMSADNKSQSNLNYLKELKAAGFTIDEILQLKREGVF
jgi:hypothetical protein